MELENELENKFELNVNLEKKQKNFFDTTLGKVINSGLDFGLRAILPDMIENQIINIKNALFENGIKDGIQTAVDSIIDFGKSVSGIFTGKFENMSQVETAIGNGGIIDTVSDLIDKSLVKVQQKGIIGYQVKNLITKGKDIILNNVTTSLKNEIKFQENSIYEIENYINNFNDFFNNKDFEGMTKEYNKIQDKLEKVIPLENIMREISRTEIVYNLIKNNGNNFNLSEGEIEFIKKIN